MELKVVARDNDSSKVFLMAITDDDFSPAIIYDKASKTHSHVAPLAALTKHFQNVEYYETFDTIKLALPISIERALRGLEEVEA